MDTQVSFLFFLKQQHWNKSLYWGQVVATKTQFWFVKNYFRRIKTDQSRSKYTTWVSQLITSWTINVHEPDLQQSTDKNFSLDADDDIPLGCRISKRPSPPPTKVPLRTTLTRKIRLHDQEVWNIFQSFFWPLSARLLQKSIENCIKRGTTRVMTEFFKIHKISWKWTANNKS